MTGLLAFQGIKVAQSRVGDALKRTHPVYQERRSTSTARMLNPVPYHAKTTLDINFTLIKMRN